jgi:hypothetical protein
LLLVVATASSGCAWALGAPFAAFAVVLVVAALCAACGASTGISDDAGAGADAGGDGDADGDACDDACGDGRCPDHMTCGADPDEPWCYPDVDEDCVVDSEDNCPWLANTDQADEEGDGLGDACDLCEGDNRLSPCGDPCCHDADGDGVVGAELFPFTSEGEDVCSFIPDPAQEDRDGDGNGDVCDLAPDSFDPLTPCGFAGLDSDGDGISDWDCSTGETDACPTTPSAGAGDYDSDAVPDPCDEDGVPPLAALEPRLRDLRRATLGRLGAEGVLDAETLRLALG